MKYEIYLALKKLSTPSTLSYWEGWRSLRVLRVRCLIGNAGGWSSFSLIFENDDNLSDELNLVDAIDIELRLLPTNALSIKSWLVVAVNVCSLCSLYFENRSVVAILWLPPNVDAEIEFSICDCCCWCRYWYIEWCGCGCMPVWSKNLPRPRVETLCMLARIEFIDTKPDYQNDELFILIGFESCMLPYDRLLPILYLPDSLEFLWFLNTFVDKSGTVSDGVLDNASSFVTSAIHNG